MTALIIIILLLVVIVVILSLTIFFYTKKSVFFNDKEKKYITFVINVFKEYGDELGIQSKKDHQKLVDELEKIKSKHFNEKPIKKEIKN